MQHSAHSRRGRAKFQGNCPFTDNAGTRCQAACCRTVAETARNSSRRGDATRSRSRSIGSVRCETCVSSNISPGSRAMTLTGCSRCPIDHAAALRKPAPAACSKSFRLFVEQPQPATSVVQGSRVARNSDLSRFYFLLTGAFG